MASKHPKEYVYLFFQTQEVNILEGFNVELRVMGVPKDPPNVPENVTDLVHLPTHAGNPVKEHPQAYVEIVVDRAAKVAHVKGIKPGAYAAEVVASLHEGAHHPRELKAVAQAYVDESDVLLYAPDGRVYWLPTEMWTKAQSFDPKHPHDMKHLAKALLPLIKNEAVVANIPREVGFDGSEAPPRQTSLAPSAPAEPVTCFLLNLNSILLSYTPDQKLDAKEQDASPFVSRKS
ncbi:hypothetical protein JY651_02935 [Pyxidicoccus parkwayensis]|uniref:Uncharacterized protein n=1 Tax=Pyxidicoccus parkwayensis TaxID=2813578 RepID=A0ABX7NYF2_9BACT|nr:hypothetical protein [Pyxidicoccus parkwaysis]QSQ23955.1 hypothetical protein JY651_02935 [Pyxidicoccus parkwaysis]